MNEASQVPIGLQSTCCETHVKKQAGEMICLHCMEPCETKQSCKACREQHFTCPGNIFLAGEVAETLLKSQSKRLCHGCNRYVSLRFGRKECEEGECGTYIAFDRDLRQYTPNNYKNNKTKNET